MSWFTFSTSLRRGLFVFVWAFWLTLCPRADAASSSGKPKWIRVSSDHFSVLTDGDEKRGREVAVRLEQMRGVFAQLLSRRKLNMSEPLNVIAFRSDKEYAAAAPIRQGRPIDAPGFFLHGEDRDYIVLNLFEPQSWMAVSHEMAHYFLNYNYPATQPWFDEGFAEYFSSLQLNDKSAEIGSDPELGVTWNEDVFGNQIQQRNPARSLTELLAAPVWLSISDLFTMHEYRDGYREGSRHTLFYAQSWIVVHYLLNKNKLPETGSYFDLVENKHIPAQDAIQQAYGASPAQFDQAVKDYFKSLAPLFLALDASKQSDAKTIDLSSPGYEVNRLLARDATDIGTSTAQVPDAEAEALVVEMELRLPEHSLQATVALKAIVDDAKAENAIAHRALAWEYMQKREFDQAVTELQAASLLDGKDPWTHYYLALQKYEEAAPTGAAMSGLPNMMQDLRAVIDWDPDFAEAYNMLAVARLQGGGTHSALDAIRPAILLSPRNQGYLLNLALIELAGKQWDDAAELLARLKGSGDAGIAARAKKNLDDLPTLKKYGVLPQAGGPAGVTVYWANQAGSSSGGEDPAKSDEQAEDSTPKTKSAAPDTRPVKFARGSLIGADCSTAPAAIVTFKTEAGKTLKLRVADYKSLVLVGAEEFKCEWTRRAATVNYKAGGKADGDIVSLELR